MKALLKRKKKEGNDENDRITAMKQVEHRDLMERFENELEEACTIEVGQSWIVENLRKPEGFCDSAWQTIYPFAMTLAYGGGDIYEGWMKDKHTVSAQLQRPGFGR